MSALPNHQTALTISGYNSEFILDRQFPIPTVHEKLVLVKNSHVSVNPIDYKLRTGIYQWIKSFPHVLGVDASGTVVAVGDQVTKFKVGDQVFGTTFIGGTYSQYSVFDENSLAPKPEQFSHQLASSIGVIFLTSFQCLQKHIDASSGDRDSLSGKKVLIIGGSGGTGAAATMLAKHYFGALVVSITSNKNVNYVKELGADLVLDYTIGKEELSKQLQSQERTFDIVIDTVGNYQDYYSINLLKENGVHTTIAGELPASGSSVFGSENYSFVAMKGDGVSLGKISGWLSESELISKIPIKTLKLEEALKAHDLIASQRTIGKIILEIPTD